MSSLPSGQMSMPDPGLEHGSSPMFGEAHEHHARPPSGGQTSTSTTIVTSPTDSIVIPPIPAVVDPPIPSAPAVAAPPSAATQESQVPDTSFSSGGTLAVDPHPGGGGDTLASCMAYWQPDTTMTQAEWHDTCVRTLNGLDSGGGVTDNIAAAAATTTTQGTRHAANSEAHRVAAHHAAQSQ